MVVICIELRLYIAFPVSLLIWRIEIAGIFFATFLVLDLGMARLWHTAHASLAMSMPSHVHDGWISVIKFTRKCRYSWATQKNAVLRVYWHAGWYGAAIQASRRLPQLVVVHLAAKPEHPSGITRFKHCILSLTAIMRRQGEVGTQKNYELFFPTSVLCPKNQRQPRICPSALNMLQRAGLLNLYIMPNKFSPVSCCSSNLFFNHWVFHSLEILQFQTMW